MNAVTFHQRCWLFLPPALLCVGDAALTLWGQSAEYWSGNFANVREFNPLGYALLAFHPLAFALGIAFYLGLLGIAMQFLARRWVVLLAFALSIGHAIGGAGWLAREGFVGCILALCFIVAAERMVGISWRKSGFANANA